MQANVNCEGEPLLGQKKKKAKLMTAYLFSSCGLRIFPWPSFQLLHATSYISIKIATSSQ